jgi:hypothetical protein
LIRTPVALKIALAMAAMGGTQAISPASLAPWGRRHDNPPPANSDGRPYVSTNPQIPQSLRDPFACVATPFSNTIAPG